MIRATDLKKVLNLENKGISICFFWFVGPSQYFKDCVPQQIHLLSLIITMWVCYLDDFHHQRRILLTLWASDSKLCNSGRWVFLDETCPTGNSYTSVPAHRKSQLQMWRQTGWMTQGMWRAKQSPASLKRGLSKVVGQLQLCAAAPLNVSGWRARTAPTCPLRPSLWFDAQSCLLIDLHLPAAVACGRVCIAFALLSPRAVRLSDKSVQRREK